MCECDIGKFYDTIYVLCDYFNTKKTSCPLDFSAVSDDLLVFFYETGRGTFMDDVFELCVNDLFEKNDIRVLCDTIGNYEEALNKVLKKYFISYDHSLYEEREFYGYVNMLILNSDYSDDVKCSLYSFVLDPLVAIKKMEIALRSLYFQVLMVRKNEDFAKAELRQGEFAENASYTPSDTVANVKDTFYSMSSFDCNAKKEIVSNNVCYMILGINVNNHNCTTSSILHKFGRVFFEKNRVKIFYYLTENEDSTIDEIKKECNLTGTNAYYHISYMIKHKVVYEKHRKKKVYYGVNRNFITMLINEIRKLV